MLMELSDLGEGSRDQLCALTSKPYATVEGLIPTEQL
jgi:hypothetical protein